MIRILLILLLLWLGYSWISGKYRAMEQQAGAAFSWMREQ